jgi:two-component system, response regulator PdtaR
LVLIGTNRRATPRSNRTRLARVTTNDFHAETATPKNTPADESGETAEGHADLVELPTKIEPEAASATGSTRRAVVAEDEALIRMDVVETLTDAGFEVVGEAGNGEEAVSLATELRPDVVVMDVKMPVMDGITAAEKIAKTHAAPVVLLTAFSQSELVERARDAGAMAYVIKPFTPADLLPAVEIAMSRHREIVALEDEIADLGERFETRKRVDRAKGLLMTKMGLSEPEAFRWIQKTSMDRRLTMREVADAVIDQVGGGEE